MIQKLLIFYIILLIITDKGYIDYLPTIPIYKNNEKEAELVKVLSDNRTENDIKFFNLTNEYVIYAYLPYVNESKDELIQIITHSTIKILILSLKYMINRARPYQVNDKINYIYTETGLTPSYPAGHALQAFYLSKILTKRYPNKEKIFDELANKCNDCRIKAGIHYPSDGEFSKNLINYLF